MFYGRRASPLINKHNYNYWYVYFKIIDYTLVKEESRWWAPRVFKSPWNPVGVWLVNYLQWFSDEISRDEPWGEHSQPQHIRYERRLIRWGSVNRFIYLSFNTLLTGLFINYVLYYLPRTKSDIHQRASWFRLHSILDDLR